MQKSVNASRNHTGQKETLQRRRIRQEIPPRLAGRENLTRTSDDDNKDHGDRGGDSDSACGEDLV